MNCLKDTISFHIGDLLKHIRQSPFFASGVFHGNLMPAYWCIANNFGDALTPLLLRHYGYTPVHFSPFRIYPHNTIAGVGSILDFLPDNYSGIILGAGFMHESTARDFPRAMILGVRGKLSRNKLTKHSDALLGDPGLLASKLLHSPSKKRWRLGIVPHYVDWDSSPVNAWRNTLGPECKVIDVRQEPLNVIREIDECEHILSSSLHGLVIADSLRIPNRRFIGKKVGGGDFKYHDYYSAFPFEPEPLISLAGNESIDELIIDTNDQSANQRWDIAEIRKEKLDNVFSDLQQILRQRNKV